MNVFIPPRRRFPLMVSTVVLAGLFSVSPARAADPDYSAWGAILGKYNDAMGRGMNYGALKANDAATLKDLRQQMAKVNVASLSRGEQLAYWINLYNISTVGIIVDNYPLKSIRDISTDPVIRLNVFKKDFVSFGNGRMSLNDIENTKIRQGFRDPRIHFAINCAARSCPPLRSEPYVGSRISAQLDDQTRRFLNGPRGVKLTSKGGDLVLRTTKIMKWFGEDFQEWGGGVLTFATKYVTADKQQAIRKAGKNVTIVYDDYDWALNSRN